MKDDGNLIGFGFTFTAPNPANLAGAGGVPGNELKDTDGNFLKDTDGNFLSDTEIP